MIKPGIRTKTNREANKILVKIYQMNGITSCEIQKEGCTGQMFLGFAHLHLRDWYWERGKDSLALLSSFKQTVLACTNCHQKIEGKKEETESVFEKLRGN